MKKIVPLLMAFAAVAIVLTGCASPAVKETVFQGPIPWDASLSSKTEICSYDVSKYVGDGSEKVNSSGSLTYRIERYSDEYYSLTTDFSITYGNSDLLKDNFKGKTDTIRSTAIFRFDNLSAIYTQKNVAIATEPSSSYEFVANYTESEFEGTPALTAVYYGYDKNGVSENRQLEFKKGKYFDNEYLYYLVRAFKSLEELDLGKITSLSENIDIVDWYECFAKNKFDAIPLIVSCSEKTASFKVDNAAMFDNFISNAEGLKDDNDKLIGCLNASIIISGIKTGPELSVMYSRCKYFENGKEALYLPVKYVTKETVATGDIAFYTEYTLSKVEM